MTTKSLVKLAVNASIRAGKRILEVYDSEFAIEHKDDKSPLTEADKRSHEAISSYIDESHIPILSEEGRQIEFEERSKWNKFWLVDPLDGTKEFIKRNGEFTVNIALIENGYPVLGVIYVPVQNTLYVGVVGEGAWKFENIESTDDVKDYMSGTPLPIAQNRSEYIMVGSRSHMSAETEEYMAKLREEKGQVEILSRGSSLKLCMVAEGSADEYPRFAPTMEWDTGAGHAICKAAGLKVDQYPEMTELKYNKEDLLNPWFLVHK